MVIVYFIFFYIWLWNTWKKNGFSAFCVLLLVYLLSSVATIILCYVYNDSHLTGKESVFPVLYHILLLFICFKPLEKIFIKTHTDYSPSKQTLLISSIFLVIINIITEIMSLSTIRGNLTYFAFNLGDIRNSVYNESLNIAQRGFDFTFVISATSIFAVVSFFELLKQKGYLLLKILLVIASFNIIVYNLKFMSRDGLLIWTFIVIMEFLSNKNNLSNQIKKKLSVVLVIVALSIFYVFYLITIGRSEVSNSAFKDPLYFFLRYLGQPFINFSELYYEDFVLHAKLSARNVFSTFVIGYVYNYGIIGTVIIAIIFNVICTQFAKKSHSYLTEHVKVFLYYFFAFGVLYRHYYFTTRGSLWSMILYMFLVFVLDKAFKNKKIILKKQNKFYYGTINSILPTSVSSDEGK